MASFTVAVVESPGVHQQVVWLDSQDPTRLNPAPTHPHTYRRVQVPATIVFRAVVDGVVGPLDSDPVLGGKIFSAVMGRWSGNFPPVVVQTSGRSSEVTVTLGADNYGHQQLLMTLPGGGGVGIPFDGE